MTRIELMKQLRDPYVCNIATECYNTEFLEKAAARIEELEHQRAFLISICTALGIWFVAFGVFQ
jgi:hypothetical protein